MYKKSDRFFSGMSLNTIRSYKQSFKLYEGFHQMDLDGLLEEAITEQTKNTPEHLLSLYDRLMDFREWLVENYKYNTIKGHITNITTWYRRNRITIPYLPPLNSKTVMKNPYIEFKDILTKDEIRDALTLTSTEMRARLMTMATGGYSREETRILTKRQFYEDTYKYHKEDDPMEAMYKLAKMDNVIWETQIIRQKTKKPYYGFTNPETTQAIARAKIREGEYDLDTPLFSHTVNYVSNFCRKINKKLDLGKAGGFGRFTPHALRRYNATYLKGTELTAEETIRLQDIDEMQGRSKTNTQDRYIKTNPLKQKLLYAKYMNNVSLYNQYTYEIGEDDIIVKRITTEKLAKENDKLKQEISSLTHTGNGLKNYINKVGESNFESQINKLLREM